MLRDFTVAAMLCCLSGAAQAALVTDQRQFSYNRPLPFQTYAGPSAGPVPTLNIGQSYTAGLNGKLGLIALYCNSSCSINQLGNEFSLNLFQGSTLLGKAVLTTTNGTLDTTDLISQRYLGFDFSAFNISQVAGTSYHFVFHEVSGPGDIIDRGISVSTRNPYAGGAMLPNSFDGAQPDYDLAFKTQVFEDVPPPPAVPEPASWAMLIAGFGLVGAFQRRRAAMIA